MTKTAPTIVDLNFGSASLLANIYLIIKQKVIKNVIKKVPEVLDKCRRVGVK